MTEPLIFGRLQIRRANDDLDEKHISIPKCLKKPKYLGIVFLYIHDLVYARVHTLLSVEIFKIDIWDLIPYHKTLPSSYRNDYNDSMDVSGGIWGTKKRFLDICCPKAWPFASIDYHNQSL